MQLVSKQKQQLRISLRDKQAVQLIYPTKQVTSKYQLLVFEAETLKCSLSASGNLRVVKGIHYPENRRLLGNKSIALNQVSGSPRKGEFLPLQYGNLRAWDPIVESARSSHT